MAFRVEYTKAALKQLKKMDRFDARLIGLTANRSGEWRYRVGDYRILCIIEDDKLIVEVFSIGHRSTVYDR